MSVWPSVLGVGVAAAAAAAVAVPAARRFVLGEEAIDWLAGETELDRFDDDGMTVFQKSGGCFRVFRLRGQPYDTKPMAAQDNLLMGRQHVFSRLADLGVTIRLFGVKRSRPAPEDQGTGWPSPTLAEIGAAEAAAFKASYDIRWYLVIGNEGRLQALAEACEVIASSLGDYGADLVTASTGDGPCALAGFVEFLFCGNLRDDVPRHSASIGPILPADLIFEKTGAITAHQPAPVHYRVIAVKAWPEEVSGEIAAEILALDGEIELSQIASPVPKTHAIALLSRKSRESLFNPFGGGRTMDEHDAVVELLSQEGHRLFTTQFQIVLRAASLPALDQLTRKLAALLARRRVAYSVETAIAPVCWFSRVPGRETLVRPLKLLTRDIAALWPFHHSPTGQQSSPWADRPVRLFKTSAGQAYAFQFHVSDKPQARGHYLVFAPTGGGKTSLITYLLAGLAKLDGVRSFVFDSLEGARFTIEALGGAYQSFDNLTLNPLDIGADTKANRQRLLLVMKAMMGDVGDDESAEQAISHALDAAFRLDPPQRTFNALFPVVFPHRSKARQVFAKWVTDEAGRAGAYSHVFNAGHDSLSGFFGESFLVGLNMNEILSDPVLGPPVVTHVAEAVSRLVRASDRTGVKGFNIFIDEAANLLRNPGFQQVVLEMYREYRKLDGVVGLAFQEPAALNACGVAEAVIQNTSTFLFFPNATADPASYVPFNLNEEQVNFIRHGAAISGGRKVLLIKRDGATGFDESVILDVDLAPLGSIVRLFRSGPGAVGDLVRLQRNHGKEWINHV